MRTLHAITGLGTGGAETALYRLLRAGLAEDGSTTVVSLTDFGSRGPLIEALGVDVRSLGMPRGTVTRKGLRELRRVIQTFRPGLIHGWMYHGNLASLLGVVGSGSPPIVWNIRHSLHDLSVDRWRTRQVIRANKWCSRWADALVFNSETACRQHVAFGFPAERSIVIPNGVEMQGFDEASIHRGGARERLGVGEEIVLVGTVGRHHATKDRVGFIDAACRVAAECDKVEFLIAGPGVVDHQSQLLAGVPDALASRFRFLSELADVPALMSAMDIYCQSSLAEAFPNVLVEAMASGLPCVATDVGDSRTILGGHGIIVPAGRPDRIAEGIIELVRQGRAVRKERGRRARARVEMEYPIERAVARYRALTASLASGSTEPIA